MAHYKPPTPLLQLQRSAVGKRPRPVTVTTACHERQLHCYSSLATNRQHGDISVGIGHFENRTAIIGNYMSVRSGPKDLCMYQFNLQQRLRHFSSGSSKSKNQSDSIKGATATSDNANVSTTSPIPKPSPSNSVLPTSSKRIPQKKRRRKKSSSNYSSSLAAITTTHPKSKTFPLPSKSKRQQKQLTLTRKQILRLTPKQRTNLQNQRLREYINSRSYLDQARTNVRSNLKYLSETAGGNFNKNMKTIKRLFNGEEVWKDTDTTNLAATSSYSKKQQESLTQGIDWEKAPAEIKANLQSNLSKTQNYLHKLTDGIIPSSSYVGIHASSATGKELAEGGSIATRVQQFHEMKQGSTRLNMDGWWFARNIAFALFPGLVLNIYFQYRQGDMKEYYEKLEKTEREKILGITGGSGSDGAVDEGRSISGLSGDGHGSSDSMGILSAMIPEGGSVWDKMKMTVNDLFLGGAEKKIEQQREVQRLQEEAAFNESTAPAGPSSNPSTNISNGDVTPEANNALESSKDATIQMLLERIQALEKRHMSKEELEEERQKQHQIEYEVKRVKQSPLQNRRDDALAARWREEAKKEGDDGNEERQIRERNVENSSYSFVDVANFTKVMMEPVVESMKELAMEKMKEAMSVFGFSTEEVPIERENNVEEEKVPTSPAVESTRTAVDSKSNSISGDDAEGEKVPPPDAAAESTKRDADSTSNSGSFPNKEDAAGSTQVVEPVEIADSNCIETDEVDKDSDRQNDRNKRGGVREWVVTLCRRIPKLQEHGAGGISKDFDSGKKKE